MNTSQNTIKQLVQKKSDIPEKENHKIARYEQETKAIFENFKEFTTGYRVLFLLHRKKERGATNNTKVRKEIVNGPKEFYEKLYKLVVEANESILPLRIYSAVNERDFEKAIRQFKYEQLDADYYDTNSRDGFYLDLRNRFIGCLMQPNTRHKGSSLFIFDIDGDQRAVGEVLQQIPDDVEIVKQYATKNGWHIVTKPFNHTNIKHPALEIKTDGLLLLKYAKE